MRALDIAVVYAQQSSFDPFSSLSTLARNAIGFAILVIAAIALWKFKSQPMKMVETLAVVLIVGYIIHLADPGAFNGFGLFTFVDELLGKG